MKLSTKIAYNTIAQVAGKVVSTILGLIAIAIMTRYLGNEGFGQYTTVITFGLIFSILADLGMTLVTSQMINKPGVDQKKVVNNLFTFRLVSALIIIGLAPAVIWLFPYSDLIKVGVVIVSSSFFFLSLTQVFTGVFQKELRTEKIAVSEVVGRAVMVAVVFLAMIFDWGLNGILLSVVATNLVGFLLQYIFVRKFVKIGFDFDWIIWKEILRRSWPLFLTVTFNLLYLRADILMLSLMQSQVDVGIYGAAYKVIDVLITLPFLFAGLILPLLVRYWSQRDKKTHFNVLQKSFDATSIITIPLMVGGYFLADPIMRFIAGTDFIISGSVLKILVLAIGAVFFGCIFTHAMISFDEQKRLIKYYIITAVTSLPLYYFAIQKFSYFGAAWITFYSETLIFFFALFAVWKFSGFLPNLKIFTKACLASLIMGVGLFFTKSFASINMLYFVIILVLAIILYFVAIYVLKGVAKEDLMDLLNRKKEL